MRGFQPDDCLRDLSVHSVSTRCTCVHNLISGQTELLPDKVAHGALVQCLVVSVQFLCDEFGTISGSCFSQRSVRLSCKACCISQQLHETKSWTTYADVDVCSGFNVWLCLFIRSVPLQSIQQTRKKSQDQRQSFVNF